MAITTDTTPTAQDFALFEASSIKQFIINQLNDSGIFIDQNYLGSNLNCFIDIIAVLLQQIQFHYNMTNTESTFATSVLYENMNKLVSLFNYKPSGRQTSILPVKLTIALNESGKIGTYVIPKYSFLNYNGSFYFKDDVVLNVTADNTITLNDIMYQGSLTESSIYNLTAEDFQIITFVDNNIKTSDNKFISDNFFDVYVREPGDKWVKYTEINSLFDATNNDKVYERRLNEHYNYEFKFGNNTNGYKPAPDSEVIIYYIISDGSEAVIGENIIKNEAIHLYNSEHYKSIILDDETSIYEIKPSFINSADLKYITVSNTGASTNITLAEDPDTMRNYVPKLFSSQNRLITATDYLTYINKNFTGFVKDSYVFNNNEYLKSYLKYYYDIGLNAPNDDPRVLLNQVSFQTSCGFNNIYVILLPLINTIINDKVPNYVSTSLKQYIITQLENLKDISHNICPIDPIYKAVSFGIHRDTNNTLPEHFKNVKLCIVRDRYSNYNSDYIISAVETIFKSYFNSVKLGSSIDISLLSSTITEINGVRGIRMTDGVNYSDKLTFIVWNPLYEDDDLSIIQQSINLEPFMFPYFYDLSNINSKITVVNE